MLLLPILRSRDQKQFEEFFIFFGFVLFIPCPWTDRAVPWSCGWASSTQRAVWDTTHGEGGRGDPLPTVAAVQRGALGRRGRGDPVPTVAAASTPRAALGSPRSAGDDGWRGAAVQCW